MNFKKDNMFTIFYKLSVIILIITWMKIKQKKEPFQRVDCSSPLLLFLLLFPSQEVFTEMEEKYGEVEEMNVCDNLGDHLVGNVYVKVCDECI